MGDLSTQDFWGVLFGRSGLALKRKETDVPLMREERKRPARTEENSAGTRQLCVARRTCLRGGAAGRGRAGGGLFSAGGGGRSPGDVVSGPCPRHSGGAFDRPGPRGLLRLLSLQWQVGLQESKG